jgi:hypothetical protein
MFITTQIFMHLQLQEVQPRRLAKESYCEERTQQLYWNQLLTIEELMLLPVLPSSLLGVFRRPYYWAKWAGNHHLLHWYQWHSQQSTSIGGGRISS